MQLKMWSVIVASLLLALFLALIPMPAWAVWWRPEWVVLVLIYWLMLRPQQVGIILSWCVGLLLDVLNGTLLGEHALALAIVAYLTLKLHRHIRFFSFWQQALCIFLLVLSYQMLLFLIAGITGKIIPNWQFWLASGTSLLLWPWIYSLLNRLQRA